MPAAGVRFRLPDGSRVWATHGDLVGPLTSSAVHLDDPAVSEAHALVSLRTGGFRLFALRGRLALEDALAWIWSNGAEWDLRLPNDPARPLRHGETFTVAQHTLTTSLMPLDSAGGATTLGPALDLEPLVIEARFDVVHIQRGARTELTLVGKPARIVSELALLGGTSDWELLAREVSPEESERASLRRRFEVCMVRLRQKLREARIRPDLVRPLGTGVVEFVLHPSDRVVDAS